MLGGMVPIQRLGTLMVVTVVSVGVASLTLLPAACLTFLRYPQGRRPVAAREAKDARMAALFKAYDGVNSAITPIVDDAYFTVVLGGEDAAAQSRDLVDNLANKEMAKLRLYLELRAETNLLVGLAETVAFVDDPALLTLFEDKIIATEKKIADYQGELKAQDLSSGAEAEFGQLNDLVSATLAKSKAGKLRKNCVHKLSE